MTGGKNNYPHQINGKEGIGIVCSLTVFEMQVTHVIGTQSDDAITTCQN